MVPRESGGGEVVRTGMASRNSDELRELRDDGVLSLPPSCFITRQVSDVTLRDSPLPLRISFR